MFSRNTVGITTLKKYQTLQQFFLHLVHVRDWGECQQIFTNPRWWRKRWESGRSVTLQSFKLFEVLLYRCLYIMGYSWECGRLLLRICHNDFWFSGLLTNRLASKIFWRHWLYERSRTFAWFSQKLQWFNKNTQFSIYSIWNIYSTSKTLPIQKNEIRLERSFECWLFEQYQLLG